MTAPDDRQDTDRHQHDRDDGVERADEPPRHAEGGAARPNGDRTAPGEANPPSALALDDARRAIEAICMVSSDPVPVGQLAQLLELSPETVTSLCRDVARSYRDERRGFVFVEVAGGWRYQSHPDQAPYIERYVLEGQSARLSPAALETLAIVAYKQPLSRAQVSAIRGVNVDGVLRTLLNRGYVAEVGRDAGPGQAVLYGTTDLFLEKLGLAGLDQLPPLGDFVPGAHVVEALEQTLRAAPDGGPTDAAPPDAAPMEGAGGTGTPASDAADDEVDGPDPGPAAAGDGGP